MTNSFGIYFGSRIISIVETKSKKVLNSIQIRRPEASSELEENISEEVRLVALLKDELRKNAIEIKEASISLSDKDLIIRTFEMPVLPANELAGAVNFEAKKYIPFKVEDLISDFQSELDKINHKNLILFVGIKKEILNKYTSILEQLGIKINSIEYSAFSILRFLKLIGLDKKGVIGVISADFQEEKEANFTVLQNEFPLFSRDIFLSSGPETFIESEELKSVTILEKLRTEIRISLDYFSRKLPNKKIEKIFLISEENCRLDLEASVKELGLSSQFIEPAEYTKYITKPGLYNLNFLKAYGCSLFKTIKTFLRINLLAIRPKIKPLSEAEVTPVEFIKEEISIITGLRMEPLVIILGLFLCIASFLFGSLRTLPVEKKLKEIQALRPKAAHISPEATYEELIELENKYKEEIAIADNSINKELWLTEILDAIPRIKPENLWLSDFNFTKNAESVKLVLEGFVYSADPQKEIDLVHDFLANLKANPVFINYFKDIALVFVDRTEIEGVNVTEFLICCQAYYTQK